MNARYIKRQNIYDRRIDVFINHTHYLQKVCRIYDMYIYIYIYIYIERERERRVRDKEDLWNFRRNQSLKSDKK